MMNFRQLFTPAELFLLMKSFTRRHGFFIHILLSLLLLSLFYYPNLLNHRSLPSNQPPRIVDSSLQSQTARDGFVSPKWEPRFFGGTPFFEKHYAFARFSIFDWSISRLLGLISAPQFVYILLITVIARLEKSRAREYSLPLIPIMISAISLLDGLIMALCAGPVWLLAGLGGMLLTRFGHRYVKGD